MTYTRTHVYVTFANPYLICDTCSGCVPSWHDNDQCGCDGAAWNNPCGHPVGATSVCPSWSPTDDCSCFLEGAK